MFLFEKQNMQNNIVLWGQFQSSNTSFRTKATLALPAMAVQSSHVCHGMKTYPEDLSLLLISWWVLSEAEEGRWHCGFAGYPERNTYIGLMRIWRWDRSEEHWAADELYSLWCALWGLQGLHSGSVTEPFLFYLSVSLRFLSHDERRCDTCLGVAPSASVSCWQLVQLWADVTSSCLWPQTNTDVLPKHRGGAVAVDLLGCCFRYCLVILKGLWNAVQSLELRKDKGLSSYCRACRNKRE